MKRPLNMINRLFTIGHSNLDIESFTSLLTQYNVTALADVRSSPYSRYLPHFNQDNLKRTLLDSGIKYVFLGQELGARPKDQNCYIEGKAVYEEIAKTQLFSQGIDRVFKGSQSYNIALMCAEKDPITCHRAILVCQHLKSFPIEINHILQDGKIESHQQLESRLLNIHNLGQSDREQLVQLSLFDSLPAQIPCQTLSLEDSLKEAYRRQGNKIAYVEKTHE
ncbi:DUF488 domain-containing protein [Crocosphaera sp. XPORK-15E]|uniref:DUF488 domain-containing protein n=1 Tax=Crocosphaera sp. XPORK-15E TaxID=3110247 RepID=UPI002B213C5C|nr:DUF488 domain-containing protein [Crocosphaera sp. XPORK-15E]MEA5536332.1 DUF488 domain-containing protein [Crocosphaera sp. XPORK-15E]